MITPQQIDRTDWSGVFGMLEMEKAAAIIVAKSRVCGKWVPCCANDFINADDKYNSALNGFTELIFRGWMCKGGEDSPSPDCYCYNGSFLPSVGFIERCAT